jgi:hypothetical protein
MSYGLAGGLTRYTQSDQITQAKETDMRRVMVRYRVTPDQADANEQLVRAVYEELHSTGPANLRYATFKLEDGVSFVHLHSDESSDGSNTLTGLPAFQRFQLGISDRCEEGPVVTELREIGSFRFFGGE